MIKTIQGEQPFQVLASNFSIGPSNEGYTLQISADGTNYSDLFSVGSGVTRMVTGVANGSYYRLYGNNSEVSINWRTQCSDGGGSGDIPIASQSTLGGIKVGSGLSITQDGVLSSTGGGVDLSAYWTSGQTKSYVDGAISGAASDYYTSEECNELFAPIGSYNEIVNEIIPAIGNDIENLQLTKASYYRLELSTANPEDFTADDIDVLNDFFAAVSGDTSLAEGAYLDVDGEVFRLYNHIINGDAGEFGFGYSDGEYLQSVQLIFGLGEYEEGNYFDNDLVGKEQIDTIDEVVSAALVDLNDRKVDGDGITNIVSISQSDYDNLSGYSPSTLYVIINNSNL